MFSESWKSRAGAADCVRLGVRGAALRGVVLSDAPGARFSVYLLPLLPSCSAKAHHVTAVVYAADNVKRDAKARGNVVARPKIMHVCRQLYCLSVIRSKQRVCGAYAVIRQHANVSQI